MIFEAKYQDSKQAELEQEAQGLLARVKAEESKQEVARSAAKLKSIEDKLETEGLSEEEKEALEAEYKEILRKITAIRSGK